MGKDNPLAVSWLSKYYDYAHAVDDVIDDQLWSPESLLKVLLMAADVYSHPYYNLHASTLQMPILMTTAIYADSVTWEKSPELWKRQWADVMRHAGNEVIMAVAMLEGGWSHVRALYAAWNASCYVYHADKYGVPQ